MDDGGGKAIVDGKVDDGGSVTSDTAAKGWTVVEVSRGSESRSSGDTQKEEEGPSPATEVSPGNESPEMTTVLMTMNHQNMHGHQWLPSAKK